VPTLLFFQMKPILNKPDDSLESQKTPLSVIPAEAGIQLYQMVTACLDTEACPGP